MKKYCKLCSEYRDPKDPELEIQNKYDSDYCFNCGQILNENTVYNP